MKNQHKQWLLIIIIIALIVFGGLHVKAQTKQQVLIEIVKCRIKHPRIVLAQSLMETGYYKCANCSMDHNNIFGFRYKGEYLTFDNWQMSVMYYKDFQDRHFKGGDYYDFLTNRGYAANMEKYVSDLKWIKKYKI